MEITVTGRHIEVTEPIRNYAVEKVGKLPRYFDRIMEIDVVVDKHDSHDFSVEIIVDAEHATNFVGKSIGDDLYGCIDSAVDKLERQLTDHKERVRSRKGSQSMSGN